MRCLTEISRRFASPFNKHDHRQLRLSDSDSCEEEDFDEESVIKYYFNFGYEYKEILLFLCKRHGHQIRYSTLLRRLKQYGLRRRCASDHEGFNDTLQKVQRRIRELINGPGSSGGYRAVWHTLEMEGLRVPRIIVQGLLDMDREDTELRRKHTATLDVIMHGTWIALIS